MIEETVILTKSPQAVGLTGLAVEPMMTIWGSSFAIRRSQLLSVHVGLCTVAIAFEEITSAQEAVANGE